MSSRDSQSTADTAAENVKSTTSSESNNNQEQEANVERSTEAEDDNEVAVLEVRAGNQEHDNASTAEAKTDEEDDEVQFLGVRKRKEWEGPIEMMHPFPWTKGQAVKQIYCPRHGWSEPRLPGPDPAYYAPGEHPRQWIPVYDPKVEAKRKADQEASTTKKRRTADGGSLGQTSSSNSSVSESQLPSDDSNDSASSSSLFIPAGEIQPQDFLSVRFIKKEVVDEDDKKDENNDGGDGRESKEDKDSKDSNSKEDDKEKKAEDDPASKKPEKEANDSSGEKTKSTPVVCLWKELECAKHGKHKVFLRVAQPTDAPNVPVTNPIQKFLGTAITPSPTKIFKFQFYAYLARPEPCRSCVVNAVIESKAGRQYIVRKKKVMAYIGCTRYCPRSRAVVMIRELRQAVPQNEGLAIRVFQETRTATDSQTQCKEPSNSFTSPAPPASRSACLIPDAPKDNFWEEANRGTILPEYTRTEICSPYVCDPPWNSDPTSITALEKFTLSTKEVKAFARAIFETLASADPSAYEASDFTTFGLRKEVEKCTEDNHNTGASAASAASSESAASAASTASAGDANPFKMEEIQDVEMSTMIHEWSNMENEWNPSDETTAKTEKDQQISPLTYPGVDEMTF